MKCFILDKKNKPEKKNLTRLDFNKIFSLHIRDLRPVFSNLQVSTILPRKNALIINLGFIKAVLDNEKVYFLEHHKSENLNNFLEKIQESLVNKKNKNFYLFIFEKILDAKAKQMAKKVSFIKQSLKDIMPQVQNDFSDINLEKMLFLKKRISKLENRLNEILSAIKEVLEDEDNFYDFIALAQSKENIQQESESILENFIEQIEEDLGSIFRAKEELDDTDQYINLKLSSQRTIIVKIDLLATTLALIFSFLAVIVGLYGVNLKNGLENSNIAFLILSLSLVLIFLISSIFFLLYLKKNKVL